MREKVWELLRNGWASRAEDCSSACSNEMAGLVRPHYSTRTGQSTLSLDLLQNSTQQHYCCRCHEEVCLVLHLPYRRHKIAGVANTSRAAIKHWLLLTAPNNSNGPEYSLLGSWLLAKSAPGRLGRKR